MCLSVRPCHSLGSPANEFVCSFHSPPRRFWYAADHGLARCDHHRLGHDLAEGPVFRLLNDEVTAVNWNASPGTFAEYSDTFLPAARSPEVTHLR